MRQSSAHLIPTYSNLQVGENIHLVHDKWILKADANKPIVAPGSTTELQRVDIQYADVFRTRSIPELKLGQGLCLALSFVLQYLNHQVSFNLCFHHFSQIYHV